MTNEPQTLSKTAEKVFAEFAPAPSTAKAAGRDVEKLFLKSLDALSVIGEGDEGPLSKALGLVRGGSKVAEEVAAKLVSAATKAFTTEGGGDLAKQVRCEGVGLSPDDAKLVSDNVVSILMRRATGGELSDRFSKLLDEPTTAIGAVIKGKVTKFFTRGVEKSEILAISKKELVGSLIKAVRKG